MILLGCVAVFAVACGNQGDVIQQGSFIRINYSLEVDGETLVSETDPVNIQLVVGQAAYPPEFERAFLGLKTGDRKVIRLEPEQAYGPIKEDMYIRVARSRLPDNISEGVMIGARGVNGKKIGARVVKILDDTVVLDQNHPLAGKTLVYKVEVLEVS